MILTEIEMVNYRGASALKLELNEKLNVFFGMNGAGKSTVLDAIALMLSWPASRIRHTNNPGRPISESEIMNHKSFASIEVSSNTPQGKVNWKLLKNRAGHLASDEKSQFLKLNDYTRWLQTQITETSERCNLPVFVYYPVNRAVVDIPLRIRDKHQFSLLSVYEEALISGANFRTFFEWFREREDLENENRKYLGSLLPPEDFQFPDLQLEAVRQVLSEFLPEFSNLTVRRNPLRMEVEKNGRRLAVNQLSDGEKCLVALLGDLARRMAIANPRLKNPLQGVGIVLIDEIDLHLHPKWQRLIVPTLVKVFPNCQFFISTHSPHVISHVQPEDLFLLEQTGTDIIATKPNESYGKNVDRILEDLMGLETTRPDQVHVDLQKVFQAIESGNLDDARTRISALQKMIGSDPELVKAGVLIRRKELIGK
ncbi:MAG: AAA family ATPase [Acidobacteria bacterium]|nr:AAA family ATPase [Acidobacteriota bacterium]